MKTFGNRYLNVRLKHDVQQHGITCIHRVVVRRDPRGDIVDNPPGDQIGSINLGAEEPHVVVSMNREIRML